LKVYVCIYMLNNGCCKHDVCAVVWCGVWRMSPPLACIFGISRLYFTCILPVSHRILGPWYPAVSLLYLANLQQIHCIPLYPTVTVSSCIRIILPYISSCICIQLYTCCIPLCLIVSHRLENGIWICPKIRSRGGLVWRVLFLVLYIAFVFVHIILDFRFLGIILVLVFNKRIIQL